MSLAAKYDFGEPIFNAENETLYSKAAKYPTLNTNQRLEHSKNCKVWEI